MSLEIRTHHGLVEHRPVGKARSKRTRKPPEVQEMGFRGPEERFRDSHCHRVAARATGPLGLPAAASSLVRECYTVHPSST